MNEGENIDCQLKSLGVRLGEDAFVYHDNKLRSATASEWPEIQCREHATTKKAITFTKCDHADGAL